MDENKDYSPLLPDRHPSGDLFVCDILDAAPKGDMASMEHPIFSLSTKPDCRVREYTHGEKWIKITPSVDGLATIHDRDIIVFCISQLMASLNEGKKISRSLRFKAYDFLAATNRPSGGTGYQSLLKALERLAGTRILTNIITGGEDITRGFGIIESFEIVRESREGRMQEIELTLSEWVFNAIRGKEVLTLHKDYFRLRKPLERRIYEIARKHCGSQNSWQISLPLLQKKCGSASSSKEFKRLIKGIVEENAAHQHLPDYSIYLEGDMVLFQNRKTMPPIRRDDRNYSLTGTLKAETYDAARELVAGRDLYQLEDEWREWMAKQPEAPRDPDSAFLGFCRNRGPLSSSYL